MSSLIILLTDNVRAYMNSNPAIELVQVFGSECIVVDGVVVAKGESAYVSGEAKELRKLADVDGGVWTSTNPMTGSWQQYLPAGAVS